MSDELDKSEEGVFFGDPLSAPPPLPDDPLSGMSDVNISSPAGNIPPRPSAPPPQQARGSTPPPQSPSDSNNGTPGGAGPTTFRPITEAEREATSVLLQQRAALKLGEMKRKETIDYQKTVEDKVVAALQGRTSAALHGAKDLLSFVKGNADMEDMVAKNFSRFSSLFGQETGTTNDALLGYSSACKSMQKLHADLQNVLASVEVKRAEESLSSVDETCKKLMSQANTMSSDLQAARDKVNKAFAAQEKAWNDCEDAAKTDKAVVNVDADPWLAGLRYQTASKALETVEAAHASDLNRLVQELRSMDSQRLSTMKDVLRSYAEARRALLAKALQNAEELCNMVEKIEPNQDCDTFLASAEIKDEELERGGGTSEQEGSNTSAASLGVWIPDEAVRQCNKCQLGFNLMRRKHHCRRCGHVFCDKCSARSSILPSSFGFGQTPQRVCDTCFELLQSSPSTDSAVSNVPSGVDFEVLKEGSLLKKGGMGGAHKAKHFVCTKAGFLHYFDSKFDQNPKGSIPLSHAKISTVDDDACAFAIETDDAQQTADNQNRMQAFFRGKAKSKFVFRSALGSLDRDAWIAVLVKCSRVEQAPLQTTCVP
mmetsp:Transcript_39749/g.124875  ORF Transcript_39749/g.124875 Transcript_39749/m.124875 type:complete len:598 (-) Transcript_39749:147-1940(-)